MSAHESIFGSPFQITTGRATFGILYPVEKPSGLPVGFLNFAHRGASTLAPENTVAAFEAAIVGEATAIEMDLRATSDGQIVVMHDSTVDRTSNGKGHVSGMTLEQIRSLDAGTWFGGQFAGEKVPTLEEVFEQIVPRIQVVLDCKQRNVGIEHRIVELARAHKVVDKTMVSSRIGPILKGIKSREPSMQTGFVAWFMDWGWWNRHIGRRLEALGATTVSPKASTITPRMIRFFHNRGFIVRAWGVGSDEKLAARLIRMGVDGMTFNTPEVLWRIQQRAGNER